jgi:hypothetical protein
MELDYTDEEMYEDAEAAERVAEEESAWRQFVNDRAGVWPFPD